MSGVRIGEKLAPFFLRQRMSQVEKYVFNPFEAIRPLLLPYICHTVYIYIYIYLYVIYIYIINIL